MQFDATINLGHVLTFGAAIIALFGGWYSMRGQVDLLHQRMSNIDNEMRRIAILLDKLTSQETRIAVLEESIRNIQRSFSDASMR